eukprot:5412581-Amphidinium_carterae.1
MGNEAIHVESWNYIWWNGRLAGHFGRNMQHEEADEDYEAHGIESAGLPSQAAETPFGSLRHVAMMQATILADI